MNKVSVSHKRFGFVFITHNYFWVILCFIVLTGTNVFTQTNATSPDRGGRLGNAYAIGDFETINTTNGNLMFRFPLGSLPAGRGSASAGINLIYNSKLYDSRVQKIRDYRTPNCTYQEDSPEPAGCLFYYQTLIEQSDKGGWKYTTGYTLEFENRLDNYPGFPNDQPACRHPYIGPTQYWGEMTYIHKLRVIGPDGSSHEMLPLGYSDYIDLRDKFYRVTHDGYIENCGGSRTRTGHPMTYYSDDGSFLRLDFSYDNDGNPTNNTWTLSFPDGSKITHGLYGSGASYKVYDRNGNYVEGLTDQFERSVNLSYNSNGDHEIRTKGVDGEDLMWTVRWKQIFVKKSYQSCNEGIACPEEAWRSNLEVAWSVVDSITEPQQMGGRSYTFTYNAHSFPNPPSGNSYGWGEVSGVTLPTGAGIEYSYFMDDKDGPTDVELTKEILKNYPTGKILTYNQTYDGVTTPVVENSGYSTSHSTGIIGHPDGSTTTNYFGNTEEQTWHAGLTYKTENSNGTKVESLWERNIPACQTGCSMYPHRFLDNPYVKTEFTSIKEVGGNYTLTAIKDFTYDKNGNMTEVREYDFVPYSSVPRTNGQPTGLPGNANDYLKRISRTEYYNDTPTASSTTYNDPDSYIFTTSKRLLRLPKTTTVLDKNEVTKSRTEIIYDFTNYDGSNTKAGNPTLVRVWDSTKESVTNPLTDGNSVKTQTTYNNYGMPLTLTDAQGNVTQISYGNIPTPTGTVSDLYPTQTVTAYGTSIARTSTATYDFYTGLVTSVTDVDNNNLTNATEYDDLGRPVKSITAVGTALEMWTTTEYDDTLRRVIVRSDLETKGDGKKIAVQHYDELGRVRLTRTIENAATEDPTNEQHGIKVQTRYKTGDPYSYQLTSNPYRAATSGAATAEESMGWTRSKTINTGKHSEIETFAGATLPEPFLSSGYNTNSTGKVRTDIDVNRTLVTDQAGKQRISKMNALGQLTDIWEITASDSSTVAVSFPNYSGITHGYQTSYSYDTLNNLTTVNQGSQTRSFSYSSLSRLLSANNPESGTISYQYDNNGNLTQKTDARGIETDYSYDELNRVTLRDYSDSTPDVTYIYDNKTYAKGKLTKVITGNVSTPFSVTEYQVFDQLGRVTQSQQSTDGTVPDPMTYTYNLSGAMVEQKYPSGRVVKNILDDDGELSIVQSKKNANSGYWDYAKNFSYTAAGAVSSMQLGNGKWESMQFNSRLQPTQIALGTVQNGTDMLKLNFEYGVINWDGSVLAGTNNGNVAKQIITTPTTGSTPGFTATQYYTYDSLNRIKIAKENIQTEGQALQLGWQQQFVYDRYGNRNFDEANTTTLPKNCGSSPNFTVCPADNPTANTANNRLDGFTFDDAGNTEEDPGGREFTYDAENKQILVKDSSGNKIGEYFYDGDGKRVKKVEFSNNVATQTTIFIYDASGKMVAEYATNVEQVSTARVSYLTQDHLGSPRVTTDKDGRVFSRRDFMPFGEEIKSDHTSQRGVGLNYGEDGIRQKFTSYERDNETDLDFAQARMYGYNHGRFMSPDPTLLSISDVTPQSWNRYVYVLNNPMKFIDPLGLWELQAHDIYETYYDEEGKKHTRYFQTIVVAVKTKENDNGASLAKQLGLKKGKAKEFAAQIGDGNTIELSQQGGLVGDVFQAVENGLTEQRNWEIDNADKLNEFAAKNQYGPDTNDCSGTASSIGLGRKSTKPGTNVLDGDIKNKTTRVSEKDARVGDIVRYARGDNIATHFANVIFRNDDGTLRAFSKSGEKGRYEIRNVFGKYPGLEVELYGKVRGQDFGERGFYRR